jgi:hypothetical protein
MAIEYDNGTVNVASGMFDPTFPVLRDHSVGGASIYMVRWCWFRSLSPIMLKLTRNTSWP